MSNRYAPLPNPRTDPENTELEAAFDESDEEEEEERETGSALPHSSESHPLYASSPSPSSSRPARVPGAYDFENVDYDYPPPGSPPAPSAVALPNNHGNSNGVIPVFTADNAPQPPQSSLSWFSRTAASVLPSHYVQRWGFIPHRPPTGLVGGGTNNDGVFANVTAKPSTGVVIQDGDERYLVPEETQSEAPPSYASAQADAVPPYWETTVLAPFSPSTPGDVVVDSLPTGSLFSFLWNALISVSFQFIGFLLTYLLHTTHAARFGSRAGLGVTLIQYGFGLRARLDDSNMIMADGVVANGQGTNDPWRWPSATTSAPTFSSKAEADEYYANYLNSTSAGGAQMDTNAMVSDTTTEWLAFFLMTVGWFVLLTSALGYWRVKRWERSILSSSAPAPPSSEGSDRRGPLSSFEHAFGISLLSRRRSSRNTTVDAPPSAPPSANLNPQRADEDDESDGEADEMRPMWTMTPEEMRADPERARRLIAALERERRLQNDLRAAGLI